MNRCIIMTIRKINIISLITNNVGSIVAIIVVIYMVVIFRNNERSKRKKIE